MTPTSPTDSPSHLRVQFQRFPLSTLLKYAGHFEISVNSTISQEQLASLIEDHFSKQTVDEQDVQWQFYKKIQSLRHQKPAPVIVNPDRVLPKRKTKKPKKFQPLEENDPYCQPNSNHGTTNPEDPVQYCICEQELSDDMIQCDNPDCKHQWFHYGCVGITDPSTLPDKWYCPECRSYME
ncbi:hypothetical protein WA588_004572 [Blastocystis sp. NMH]